MIRVVIGEDDLLVREGLTLVLNVAGMEVVGSAGDSTTLTNIVQASDPDVVVTDIRMPPGNSDDGLRAAIAIRRLRPKTAVMVLSQFVQRRYALELMAENPSGIGYLLKQRLADVQRFSADVRQVAAGGTVLDPEVVEVMLARAHRVGPDVDRLTPRQRDVLTLIAQGRSNQAIATKLGISEKAVVQHASRIYDVMEIPVSADDHRRVLAVVRFLSQ